MKHGQEPLERLGTTPPDNKGAKEHIYDSIPLSKKQLNIIIVVLIVAIIVFFVIGVLMGNGVL
jgi:hypothetical protein